MKPILANVKSTSDYFVSVIVILENAESYIKNTIQELDYVVSSNYNNYEILLIDNGSSDKTINRLIPLLKKIPCVRIIRLSRAYDTETAIYAGLDGSIGDGVIVLDPFIDPIKLIPKFVTKLKSEYDIVYGVYQKQQAVTHFGDKLLYWYIQKYLKIIVSTDRACYIAMNRRAINAITRVKSQYRNLKMMARQVGFAHTDIKYTPLGSDRSLYKRSIVTSLNSALDIVVTYSRHPLRFVTWLGFAAGLINLTYVGYVISVYIFRDQVAEGWTTLSLQTACMFLFVFLILIVLSEYIGRILEESRDQPIYNIMEEISSNVQVTKGARRNIVH